MKKTLLSVLAGLTVMGSASAAPTPEDRKALCQLLIDKGTHVWVEKTQACILVNPCQTNEGAIKRAYCIKDFEGIQVSTKEQATALSKKYIEVHQKEGAKCQVLKNNSILPGTDDYIKCVTDSGMYFALQFDDFNNSQLVSNRIGDGAYNKYDIARATLMAYGKYNDKSVHTAYGITETECNEIADFASYITSLDSPMVYHATYYDYYGGHSECRLSYDF
ncbi:MAG: hypothetical protein K6B71_00275 [Alphaproteobacteria bacterium]|nr:hypothetical protein [Alphaproteobacteria bacterium]